MRENSEHKDKREAQNDLKISQPYVLLSLLLGTGEQYVRKYTNILFGSIWNNCALAFLLCRAAISAVVLFSILFGKPSVCDGGLHSHFPHRMCVPSQTQRQTLAVNTSFSFVFTCDHKSSIRYVVTFIVSSGDFNWFYYCCYCYDVGFSIQCALFYGLFTHKLMIFRVNDD